jgi:ribosomal protein L16 Arg81 hydroxylase
MGRRLELVQRLLTLQATHAARPSGVERRLTPSTEEFFDRYYATSTPVIFTDLVTSWPALGKWTPEYFRDHFRDVPVAVTTDRESDPIYDARTEAHTQTMTMGEFAERVLAGKTTNDFYMVARNKNVGQAALAPLLEDVRYPEGWFVNEEIVGSSALWFGPAGTVTPLHHDASSILFCQIYGRKHYRLASPLEVSLLEGALSMYSSLDLERPGDDPRATGVTFKELTLEPGEALFIPAGWWHHVRALEPSISFASNHFARPNNFDAWYRPGEVR